MYLIFLFLTACLPLSVFLYFFATLPNHSILSYYFLSRYILPSSCILMFVYDSLAPLWYGVLVGIDVRIPFHLLEGVGDGLSGFSRRCPISLPRRMGCSISRSCRKIQISRSSARQIHGIIDPARLPRSLRTLQCFITHAPPIHISSMP